ncbi:MAG TPA: OpgC domain-containing protein, partial [Bacteroidota bacterium]|nr:OpgC domain-containing protein [Bacteroidota bacterium]
PVAGYMNGTYAATYSGFPLFPWSAFIFGGAVVGYHYVEARQRGEETHFFKNIIWIAAALVVLSFPLESITSGLYASHDVARTSPAFFFLRLGIVLLLCAALFFHERQRSVSPRSIITLVGRESLIVYAVHLFLIYGNIGTFNFAKTVHHSFGYVEASITTLVLVAVMIVLAFLWSRVRLMHPRVKWTIHWLVTAGFVVVFFFGPKA